MYNLLVSSNVESWENDNPFELEKERIFEYTNPDIKKIYEKLSSEDLDQLKNNPCIFAYEKFCQKYWGQTVYFNINLGV